jgi:hypothetical protein
MYMDIFFELGIFPNPTPQERGSFFLTLEACETRVDPEDRTQAGRLPLASATTEPPARWQCTWNIVVQKNVLYAYKETVLSRNHQSLFPNTACSGDRPLSSSMYSIISITNISYALVVMTLKCVQSQMLYVEIMAFPFSGQIVSLVDSVLL